MAEIAALVGGVILVLVLAMALFTHLGNAERCGWAGAEFALEWDVDWDRGCQLKLEDEWVHELVVRRKMKEAEAQVERRRGALLVAIEEDRVRKRAEGADGPDAQAAATERMRELKELDDARSLRRGLGGDERGAEARRKLLAVFVDEERKARAR